MTALTATLASVAHLAHIAVAAVHLDAVSALAINVATSVLMALPPFNT